MILDMNNYRICAIVPSYNAGVTLRDLLPPLLNFCSSIAVIDDGSEDDTASAAKAFESRGVVLIRHEYNMGKGAALRTGFSWALEQGFDMAVTLDSDLQHTPEDLPGILRALTEESLDLVVGSRINGNGDMPGIRRFGNRFSSWVAGRFCHRPIPDSQCGYRLYRLASCRSIMKNLILNRFDAETEILIKAALRGLRIGFTPITVIYPEDEEHRSYYRPIRDTALIVRFYTREYCRRVFTKSGREDVRALKSKAPCFYRRSGDVIR